MREREREREILSLHFFPYGSQTLINLKCGCKRLPCNVEEIINALGFRVNLQERWPCTERMAIEALKISSFGFFNSARYPLALIQNTSSFWWVFQLVIVRAHAGSADEFEKFIPSKGSLPSPRARFFSCCCWASVYLHENVKKWL